MGKLEYLNAKEKFLAYAYDVFQDDFNDDRGEFEKFFNSINGDELKDKFLMIAGHFKYLVKDGVFLLISPPDYVDYLDNTYKLVAIFSLIETLYSEEEFVEFYKWLIQKERRKSVFPIKDHTHLESLYKEYNAMHGATRKATRFFESLDEQDKSFLQAQVRFVSSEENNPSELAAEILSKELYRLRSEFVHKAHLVPELSNGVIYSSRIKGKLAAISLSVATLSYLFKRGVLKYFGYTGNNTSATP